MNSALAALSTINIGEVIIIVMLVFILLKLRK